MQLALFDLDHTLLPYDSDYAWTQYLIDAGAVDREDFTRKNDDFYAQYRAGMLNVQIRQSVCHFTVTSATA